MCDIKQPSSSPGVSTTKKTAYVPPNKRGTTSGQPEKPPLTENDFPGLGSSKVCSPTANSPKQEFKAVTGNFKQTIMNLIEFDKMNEIERNRLKETDPMKMTNEQLRASGWEVLSLKDARSIAMKPGFGFGTNGREEPSFYMHYTPPGIPLADLEGPPEGVVAHSSFEEYVEDYVEQE